jgi:hypothetical protein
MMEPTTPNSAATEHATELDCRAIVSLQTVDAECAFFSAAQAAYHRHATQRLFRALLQSMLQNINADHAARLQRLFRALLQSMLQNINADHAARLLQDTPTSVPCYGQSNEIAFTLHCYRACYIASLLTRGRLM